MILWRFSRRCSASCFDFSKIFFAKDLVIVREVCTFALANGDDGFRFAQEKSIFEEIP